VMDAAKVSIEQSRKEAELQFRNEVSKFSIEIAEKMVRKQLDNEASQKALVDKMLDEIEKN
ncbi:MAG: ATP synthase F0 subunit B, partial [Muribaculaceae bacterium]|nr:ATP synthase F0 subunit B [Muribaculaceae bacterium]